MLTQYSSDPAFMKKVLLTILDKGLLAIIVLALSLIISMMLERYKAKLGYSQIFAGRRMDAYADLLNAILRHLTAKDQYVKVLTKYHTTREVDQTEFTEKRDAFADSLFNLNTVSNKNMIYISKKLLSKLTEFSGALHEKMTTDADEVFELLSSPFEYLSLQEAEQILLDEVKG
jgi:flagellar basal body-associated protein FliL